VLNALRRGWTVTPAVAVTRNQDVIHRAVGRPGVVLVGEGAPSRLTNLLAAERRRHARLVGDTPIYEVQAGDAEDQVRLRKLQRHVMKRALGSGTPPLPKGPLPRNIRMPKSPRVR
jgi:hypothetical protein